MEKHLFLGDEAIAQAAIDAGISGVYAYPGTPSTEITEYIQGSPVTKERGIHCRWSANEKTAMEAALVCAMPVTCALLHEARGFECSRRLLYERRYERYQRRYDHPYGRRPIHALFPE